MASESTVASILAPATALVHPRVTGIRSHLLDLHLVSSNVTGSLLYQLPDNALILEGDEAEVLGRVGYRHDNLSDFAELTKVVLNFGLANPRVGEPAHADLARLDVCLRYCDTFTLQNNNKEFFFVPTLFNYLELVIFVFQRIVDRLLALVEKKGEAP